MKHRALNRSTPAFEAINVTPLIDVVMCLIVFFLIVGKLAHDTGDIRLPSSASGKPDRPARAVTISVAKPRADGPLTAPPRLFVDGLEAQNEDELRALIAEHAGIKPTEGGGYSAPLIPVHVRCHKDLPYAAVTPVLRACATLRIPGVRIATERVDADPATGGTP